jgi:putative lipoprotein
MVDNSADSGLPDQDEPQANEIPKQNGWLIAAFVLIVLILVGILGYAILSTSGFIAASEPTQPDVFITITEPVQGALLDTTWAVPVKGEGGGLFEGNVVVQALSASGEVLAQQPTIIDAPDAGIGGAGPWSVNLHINAPAGTQGQIVAFSTSPVDGSTVAMDSVNVGYGESPVTKDLVNLETHFWNLVSLNSRSLIEDTLITLQFENFQAFGSGGCNRYNTSYERRGNSLNFGLVTSTAKECEEPAGILAQESEYYTALERVLVNRIENQQLQLFDNSGNLLLVYDAVVMVNIISQIETELPEEAIIYISLSDVSLADAEAQLIVEQIIIGITQFPIPYSLNYNPRQIIENHTYAIGVRIEDSSDNLLFINPTAYHIITAGNPSQVDIVVEATR